MTFLERTVNGQPGLVARQDGVTLTVFAFHIAADRIKHLWVVRNPEKLRRWTTDVVGNRPCLPAACTSTARSTSGRETVMREISSRIPPGLRRMTDGETGERGYWIRFQIQKFGRCRSSRRVAAGQAYETTPDAPGMAQLRLADGASADTIHWPDLGYADAYAGSFEIFDRLQQDGTIPADVRFQVQYPTPIARSRGRSCPRNAAARDVLRGRAPRRSRQGTASHRRTIASPCNGTSRSSSGCWRTRLARHVAAVRGDRGKPRPLCRHVPDDVPVGMHLCYGDYGHQHFKQPDSLDLQVRLVNAVLRRQPDGQLVLVHGAPRPRRRGLFRPAERPSGRAGHRAVLRARALLPGRPAAGHDRGAGRHIDAALAPSRPVREWGICTECGMGRVASGTFRRCSTFTVRFSPPDPAARLRTVQGARPDPRGGSAPVCQARGSVRPSGRARPLSRATREPLSARTSWPLPQLQSVSVASSRTPVRSTPNQVPRGGGELVEDGGHSLCRCDRRAGRARSSHPGSG